MGEIVSVFPAAHLRRQRCLTGAWTMTVSLFRSVTHAIDLAAHPLVGAPDDFDPVMDRVGNARLVLIGEATHGTHEFYRIRAEITKRLILSRQRHGSDAILIGFSTVRSNSRSFRTPHTCSRSPARSNRSPPSPASGSRPTWLTSHSMRPQSEPEAKT